MGEVAFGQSLPGDELAQFEVYVNPGFVNIWLTSAGVRVRWGYAQQVDKTDPDSWTLQMPGSKGGMVTLKGFNLSQAMSMLLSRMGGQITFEIVPEPEEAAVEV